MLFKKGILFCVGLVGVVLLGAGCASGNETGSGTLTDAMFVGLDPKAAALKVQFQSGDGFELQQTFFGIGSFLATLKNSAEGQRVITIQGYQPQRSADIRWSAEVERETEASKKAREVYEKDLREHPRAVGEVTPTPPVAVIEKIVASGTVSEIDLRDSHKLFPPAYWPEQIFPLHHEKGALWLSSDAFQELLKTRKTSLSFGLFDETAAEALKRVRDLQDLVSRLQRQAVDEEKRLDPFLLEADSDFVDWTIKVNGRPVQISAMRARNWFGEVVILNNPQNPLILKLTINPLLAGADGANQGWDRLKNLFGYEVVRVSITEHAVTP